MVQRTRRRTACRWSSSIALVLLLHPGCSNTGQQEHAAGATAEINSIRAQGAVERALCEERARAVPYSDIEDHRWQYYRRLLRKIVRIQSLSRERYATRDIVQLQIILLKAYRAEADRNLLHRNRFPPKLLTCLVCRSTMAFEKWCRMDGCQVDGAIIYDYPEEFLRYRMLLADYLKDQDSLICETQVDCE